MIKDSAWGESRCNVLCRPTQHVASAFSPRGIFYHFGVYFMINHALFNMIAGSDDAFLTWRVEIRLCNGLTIRCNSI